MSDATKKIRIERQNDIRLFELVLRISVAAKRSLRSSARRVLIHRLPLHHLRLRIRRLHLLPLCRQCWRGDGLAQEVNSLSAIGLLSRSRKCLLEAPPARRLSAMQHMLRTTRTGTVARGRALKRATFL